MVFNSSSDVKAELYLKTRASLNVNFSLQSKEVEAPADSTEEAPTGPIEEAPAGSENE